MKVKFKENAEPCVVYEVKNPAPAIEYDEVQGKYCECIDIAVLGMVPVELLTIANHHPQNISAIDIAVELSK